ncbi:MAG: hypothetical protein ACK5D5_09600 [Bacteroidota bacterium]
MKSGKKYINKFDEKDILTSGIQSNSISIWLDDYDDLFSDFDPRNYGYRNISDDFLFELKKMSVDLSHSADSIILMLPANKRNLALEKKIILRLRSYLRDNYLERKLELNFAKKKSLLFLFIGFILIFISGYISKYQTSILYVRIIFVLTEPSGWYFAWTGFENYFLETQAKLKTVVTFKKLANAKVIFLDTINYGD